jgi:HD-GYP domain-containing protein (c-di-GMP phosphodiesterase class II)
MPDIADPAVEKLFEGFDRTAPTPLSRRERVVESAAGVAFLAAAVPMALLLDAGEPLSPGVVAVLVVAYAAARRVRFAIGFGYTVPTQLVFVPMLFLLPPGMVPLAVAAGAALAGLPDLASGRRHPDRALIYLGDSWHAIGPALVFALAHEAGAGWSDWPVYAAALAAQFAFDAVGSTLREWLALGISPRMQPRLLGWVFLVDLLLTPIGLLAAFASEDAPLSVLATLPLAALLAIFARERQQRITGALELSRAYRGTTLLLSDVLEADDEYTGMHSRDVVSLALATADELGLDAEERRNVEFGALLHDLGKIAIPTELINKPGPLSDDEWVVVKTHTIEGQRMLDHVGGVLSEVGRIVRSTHERWDGAGYPDGLAGDEIPLEAAIVSCCDAFDAMTTNRSYRRARPPEQALAELLRNAGTQFHPDVVDVVVRIVEQDMRTRGERLVEAPLAASETT